MLILVGGKGTRLGPLTRQTPKPLLDVNGRAFLDYLIENFARYGFQNFLLLAGYYGQKVKTYYLDNPISGVNIEVVIEKEVMGTAGCLSLVKDRLHDIFVVSNGDSFFDFNYLALADNFYESDYTGHIALRNVGNANRFGRISLGEDNRTIVAFEEKSNQPSNGGLINGGIYLFKRTILDLIDKSPCSMETDIFSQLVKDGKLSGSAFDGYFVDIGIPQTYSAIQNEILSISRRPAVLFDRDDTLNKDHFGYSHKAEQLEWVEGAIESIRLCNDLGFYVFVVTNQSGVAKGKYSENAVISFHQEMQNQLNAAGAHIDDFVYCPHHPNGSISKYSKSCDCRKPNVGMLKKIDKKWQVDWTKSLLIGDKVTDIEAAHSFGIEGHLFKGENLFVELKKVMNLND